ncbi:MAG: hypothetical protein Q4A71_00220 [Actinomycetaceae bacterium]|nr:hypothetical protein [Actinomycetaceae bacterium]
MGTNVNRLDPRTRSLGWARLLIFLISAVSLWIAGETVREFFLTQLWLVKLSGLLTALALLVGMVGTIHNGTKMRRAAWVAYVSLLVGLFVVFGVSDLVNSPFSDVLDHAGRAYYYAPAIIPIVAILWLAWSDPRRLVGR